MPVKKKLTFEEKLKSFTKRLLLETDPNKRAEICNELEIWANKKVSSKNKRLTELKFEVDYLTSKVKTLS